jgi:antirestriction protein ArdC
MRTTSHHPVSILLPEFSVSDMLLGIENTTIENSVAYIQGWLKALKNDKALLVHAATQAKRSTNYILNVTHTSEDW